MTSHDDVSRLDRGGRILAAAFLGVGGLHLVRPSFFHSAMPPQLPAKRELILASGVIEVACGLGLVVPRTRRLAGLASVPVLLAIFPANVQMAMDAWRAAQEERTPRTIGSLAVTVARLPLQFTLIRSALRQGR